MERYTGYLDLPVGAAARTISALVEKMGVSSKMTDCHELRQGEELRGIVLIFEKYYARAGSRLSMTVTLDDLEGRTRVHWVVTGGEGIFGRSGDSKVAAEKYGGALREALFSHLAL